MKQQKKRPSATKSSYGKWSWLKNALVHLKLDFHFQRIHIQVSVKSHCGRASDAVTRAEQYRGCAATEHTWLIFFFGFRWLDTKKSIDRTNDLIYDLVKPHKNRLVIFEIFKSFNLKAYE